MTATPAAPPVDLPNLREAQAGLRGIARVTPMVESAALSRAAGVPVFLKAEHLQPIGAFKLRGAYTALRRLSAEARARGVVTHSSGNHGIAVSWAARELGLRATVVVPADAPAVKIDAIRANGAELILIADRAEREPTTQRLIAERGLSFVPPFDHPDVLAGQGTVGLEIVEQRPDVATVVVPVSGGGFLGGVATAVHALRPATRIFGAEPEGAAKLTAALKAGQPSRIATPRSMADGLLSPSVGQVPFQQMRGTVTGALVVSEDAIGSAVRFLWEQQGWRVEPSGATAVAAVRSHPGPLAGPVVVVVSGGNVDPALFSALTGVA